MVLFPIRDDRLRTGAFDDAVVSVHPVDGDAGRRHGRHNLVDLVGFFRREHDCANSHLDWSTFRPTDPLRIAAAAGIKLLVCHGSCRCLAWCQVHFVVSILNTCNSALWSPRWGTAT